MAGTSTRNFRSHPAGALPPHRGAIPPNLRRRCGIDVRGFTEFAERAAAQDVVASLNELYEAVVPVIERHGGHANNFVGDGLLAVFGAPDRHADHAARAVAAASEISQLVGQGL